MKKPFVITAAFFAVASALVAQTLNVTAPGYSAVRLFNSTPGFTISGMGADSAGTIYYLESDSTFPGPASTKLYKRTAASGYAPTPAIFDYGSAVFGSFVTVQSGKVYFGESSANTIRSVNLDGSSPALIGTVIGNFDLAFSGGNAFVSANPDVVFPYSNPRNKILKLDLATGATQAVLDATPDFSASLEFDASGNLIYGVAKSTIGGIYRYSAASVASAIATSTPLVLTPPTSRVLANGGNQYLAYASDSSLWQDDSNAQGTLRNYNLGTSGVVNVGTTASASEYLGHLDYQGSTLYANVTNFGTNRSAIFGVVPEPSSAVLLAVGVLIFARRRK